MKAVFVGDCPSKKNADPNIPFIGTKSFDTLFEWIKKIGIDVEDVILRNSHNNTELRQLKMLYNCETRFVALGNKASLVLERLGIDHVKMPHPSGLNRKLNDELYVRRAIKECKNYLGRD